MMSLTTFAHNGLPHVHHVEANHDAAASPTPWVVLAVFILAVGLVVVWRRRKSNDIEPQEEEEIE